jgi:hypothetical protein
VIVPAVVRNYGLAAPLFGLAWVVQFWLVLLLAITLYDDLYGEAEAQAAPSIDAPSTESATPGEQPGEGHAFQRHAFQ